MRTIDATLLAEQKKTNYTPAKSVSIGGVDLSSRFIGYDYREDIGSPKPTVLVLDNSDLFFHDAFCADGESIPNNTYLGEIVDLRRGARIDGMNHLEKLPRLWVEGYRFTHKKSQSLFLVDCIDWRGRLDRIRPETEVIWSNTLAQTIVEYLLDLAGLTLDATLEAVSVNFTFPVGESAHTALSRLLNSLPDFLFAGLDGVIKSFDIVSFSEPDEYRFGWNSDHPVRPATEFGFSLQQHNLYHVIGAGGISNVDGTGAQISLAGYRRKTITDSALRTIDDIGVRIETELSSQSFNSKPATIYCLPSHGLELMSFCPLIMPNAATDTYSGNLVTGYRETNLPGKFEQVIQLNQLPERGGGGAVVSLLDGLDAPGASEGRAQIFVDAADGNCKIRFGDGDLVTIAVNP